jgi:hypothetical protein
VVSVDIGRSLRKAGKGKMALAAAIPHTKRTLLHEAGCAVVLLPNKKPRSLEAIGLKGCAIKYGSPPTLCIN